jgi:Fe-S cluster assembly ATP-binding protein
MLHIENLHVSVDGKEVVQGVSLTVQDGEIHTIMGPNGSGKSSLTNAIMGHPLYTITSGSLEFQGNNLLQMEPHERAQAGLFLAFQYPKDVAGITLRSFLFAAYNACHASHVRSGRSSGNTFISPIKFQKFLEEQMKQLHMDTVFAERFVNKGFSGGEKKKSEILQMKVLQPTCALLDETDSGLDVDALKIVAEGVNSMRTAGSHSTGSDQGGQREEKFSAVIVTHYARILEYIQPDFVHVMVNGKIVESGGADFARSLESSGYKKYLGV